MKRAMLAAALVLAATACGTPTGSGPSAPATPTVAPSSAAPSPAVSYTWPPTTACGHERWPVKTGTDQDAANVDLAHVTGTTVAAMNTLTPPAVLPQDARISPVEVTVYRVHATLTGFKQEADSDYHLILADGGKTMIAEIPDPACVGKGSPLLPGIELARTEFDARFHASAVSFTQVSVPVTVTGAGFFDFKHGQDGVADNAVELHPVLAIQFGSGG